MKVSVKANSYDVLSTFLQVPILPNLNLFGEEPFVDTN